MVAAITAMAPNPFSQHQKTAERAHALNTSLDSNKGPEKQTEPVNAKKIAPLTKTETSSAPKGLLKDGTIVLQLRDSDGNLVDELPSRSAGAYIKTETLLGR